MTRMAPEGLALARRVIAGEESAFEEFFSAYFPRLYRFARVRLGGNDDGAEDVVQTTLIKALEKLHTYRGEADLFTWLCTFCRWEIAAWFKRTGRTARERDQSLGCAVEPAEFQMRRLVRRRFEKRARRQTH